jgi:hypothetical protein
VSVAPAQCIDCEFADLKAAGSMARDHGFTKCKRKESYRFESLSMTHVCPMFKRAPEDRIAERRNWATREGFLQ